MEHIWRLKIFGSWRGRKRENEKDKNIGRRNTFGQSRRRRTEKEKEGIWGISWRRKVMTDKFCLSTIPMCQST